MNVAHNSACDIVPDKCKIARERCIQSVACCDGMLLIARLNIQPPLKFQGTHRHARYPT